jgi:hypothetical protein
MEQEASERGRHRVPDTNPLCFDPARQLQRKGGDFIRNHYNTRSGSKRSVDVKDREVEMKRCVARESVPGPDGKDLRRPVDKCQRIAMT